jgi:hypothetical protein
MNPDNSDAEVPPELREKVGYGHPPEATRFKAGVSGNPKGRPIGSLNVATVLTRALRERVVINENGRRKTVTKLEAALKQLVNKAASGDIRALRELLNWARDAEARHNGPGVQNTVIEEVDQEIIDGILKRFKGGEEEARQKDEDLTEENYVEDQRG